MLGTSGFIYRQKIFSKPIGVKEAASLFLREDVVVDINIENNLLEYALCSNSLR